MRKSHASTFAHQSLNGCNELVQILAQSEDERFLENNDPALLAACRVGNILVVQGLLQLGSNVNARNEGESTPLMICTELSQTAVARVLIGHGANINAVNSNGETALILSVYSDKTEMTRLLLEQPNIDKEHQNNDGYTALMCAIDCLNWGAIFLLLDSNVLFGSKIPFDHINSSLTPGIMVKTRDLAEANGSLEVLQMLKHCKEKDINPLEQAVSNRDLKLTKCLIQHGFSSPTTPSICSMILKLLNCTHESVSILSNIDVEIINTLLDQLDDSGEAVEKEKVLELAVAMGNYDLVQLFGQRGFIRSAKALGLAATNGKCDILQLLLEITADTSRLDSNNQPEYIGSALQLAIVNEKIDCAKILIIHGSKINLCEALADALNHDSEAALQFLIEQYPQEAKVNFNSSNIFHVAVKMSNRIIINTMLDHGADVELIIHGKTTLMRAVDPVVIDLLVERGADVNLQVNSIDQGTALHYSLSQEYSSYVTDDSIIEDIIRKLLENGSNVNVKNLWGMSPLNVAAQRPGSSRIIRLLVKSGAYVNERGYLGQTGLHVAVENDHIENIRALLDAGADVNVTDDLGRCPLFGSRRKETFSLLLDNGANVNTQDGEGNTMLMNVLKNNDWGNPFRMDIFDRGREDLCDIQMLIDAGCDVNAKNHKFKTALMMAAKSCNQEVLRTLLMAQADVNAVTEDRKKNSALKICLKKVWEDPEEGADEDAVTCCRILLEHKASVEYINLSIVHKLIANGHNSLVEQFIHAGLGPSEVNIQRKIQGWFKGTVYISPLSVALLTYNTSMARYLFRINFLTNSDLLTLSRKKNVLKYLKSQSNLECMKFLEEVSQKPLSLETLCVIVVSSAIGLERGREERISKTGLPTPIQDFLLFKHGSVTDETNNNPGSSGNSTFTQYMYMQYIRMSLLSSLQKSEQSQGSQSFSDCSENDTSD